MTRANDKRLAALEAHRAASQFPPLDPSGPSVPVQIRMPPSLLERIDAVATAAEMSRSDWIRLALTEAVDDHVSSSMNQQPFVRLAVGEPHPEVKTPLPEAPQLVINSATIELRIVLNDPTEREVRGIKVGHMDLELLYHHDLIWALVRFEPGLPWSEAVYTQWLVPEEYRRPPQPLDGTEERYLLTVVLLDAATGTVHALRVVTLSTALSWRLRDYYSRQAQTTPIDETEYYARSRRVQTELSTAQLVTLARQEA